MFNRGCSLSIRGILSSALHHLRSRLADILNAVGIAPRGRFRVTALLVLAFAASHVAVQAQTFNALYDFRGSPDCYQGNLCLAGPVGLIAQGRDGNLYSSSTGGGYGGAIWGITPQGEESTLWSFDLGGELGPQFGLTLGTDGNFYGTTREGGANNEGTVFKITPSGQLTVLYNFTGKGDGCDPNAPPVEGIDGNFYGTTISCGQVADYGYGTVYKITPSGKFTTLHQFGILDGNQPYAPLVQGTDGNFYGTTQSGGHCCGVVFKITPSGKFTLLYAFAGTSDGANPFAQLVEGPDGSFYGTTTAGGGAETEDGTVFKITSTGKYTSLHSLLGSDGSDPYGGLVLATDGNFYGTTAGGGTQAVGVIYRITPAGDYSVLLNFESSTTGSSPDSPLVQRTDGVLYGDTTNGPVVGYYGTFFSFDLSLHPFVSLLTTSGKAGQVVEILGNGLTGTTSVKFGIGSASFTLVSDTYLTAVVPAIGTTGAVTVTTPSGMRESSKNFRVLPVISSYTPTSGDVGTQVVIKGTGLKQTTRVTFGGVKATSFTVNSATQVTATVPTGAKTGKIVITTSGGTATSATSFTVS
jgi:uncharacterized repeat protein (TIGR03803 family)